MVPCSFWETDGRESENRGALLLSLSPSPLKEGGRGRAQQPGVESYIHISSSVKGGENRYPLLLQLKEKKKEGKSKPGVMTPVAVFPFLKGEGRGAKKNERTNERAGRYSTFL